MESIRRRDSKILGRERLPRYLGKATRTAEGDLVTLTAGACTEHTVMWLALAASIAGMEIVRYHHIHNAKAVMRSTYAMLCL